MREPLWDYWCPAEGSHVVHPNELQVGMVSVDDEGRGTALCVVAIIPPLPTEPHPDQAEGFAQLLRDALAGVDWYGDTNDGLAAWAHAHGMQVPWPRLLVEPSPEPENHNNKGATP